VECRLVSNLATNQMKRDTFARIAEEADKCAEEMETLIASGHLSTPDDRPSLDPNPLQYPRRPCSSPGMCR
jgi:hypothetical protein